MIHTFDLVGRQASVREPQKHTQNTDTPRREVHRALVEAIPVLRIAGCSGYIGCFGYMVKKKEGKTQSYSGRACPPGCRYSFLLIQRHTPSCPMIHPPSRLSDRLVRFFATPCPDSASRQTPTRKRKHARAEPPSPNQKGPKEIREQLRPADNPTQAKAGRKRVADPLPSNSDIHHVPRTTHILIHAL